MKTILFNVWEAADSTRPQGVYRIATILRKNGWDVNIVEFFNHWPIETLKEYVKTKITNDTKFVGFSFLYATFGTYFSEFVSWFKITYPDIIIITGSSSNFQIDFNLVDYHVHGFGEIATIELLKYLFSDGKKPKFNLIKSNNHTKRIDANVFYQAFPMKELMVEYRDDDFLEPDEWLCMETSRGCIFECDFCSYPVLGVKGDYTRSVEDFELQLKTNYDKYGITNYNITDETFNDSTAKIIKYADVVEKLPFETVFCACLRPELLVTRPTDREHLLRMNLFLHFFGIESFKHETRKVIGKGMHPDKIKKMLLDHQAFFKSNGVENYRFTTSFISGLPGETIDSFREGMNWMADNCKGFTVNVHPLCMNSEDFNGRISKMTANYQKYDYEKMTEEEVKISKKKLELEKLRGNHLYFKMNNLIWKNKNMDYFDAIKLSNDLCNFIGSHFKNLGDYTIGALSLKGSYSDRMKCDDYDNDVFRERVNTYIHKKINS